MDHRLTSGWRYTHKRRFVGSFVASNKVRKERKKPLPIFCRLFVLRYRFLSCFVFVLCDGRPASRGSARVASRWAASTPRTTKCLEGKVDTERPFRLPARQCPQLEAGGLS